VKPIFVAIDTPDLARAKELAEAVRDEAGGVKLGLEFFSANGPEGIRQIAALGLPIFLDLKLHDIPNTVAQACAAATRLGVWMLNVHAAGGSAMLTAARDAVVKAAAADGSARPLLVAVTLLTSLDAGDLSDLGIQRSPAEQVAHLAWVARDSGVDGIVCSGAEVAEARKAWPDGFFVVPGIRPAGADVTDQKRVVTPSSALRDGASILVIGRPITGASDPRQAIMDIAIGLDRTPAELRI